MKLKRTLLLLVLITMVVSIVGLTAEKPLTFVMAINAGNIPFMVPLRQGAMDAGKEFGVKVEWLAPPSSDVNQLNNLVENLIMRKVDGIALQAPNWESVANVVGKVKQANIPIITVNNYLEGSNLPFVGQEDIAAGEMLGKELIKALSGEGDWAEYRNLPKKKPKGKIVFYIDVPGQKTLEARMQGVRNACKDYPEIEFVNVFDVTTRGSVYAKRVVEDASTRYPDLAAHVSVVGIGTAMAGQIVKEKGLVGDCVVVGWDLLDQTLSLIKEGVVAASIGQNPYAQGYEAVKTLYEHVKLGKPMPQKVDTGAEIVTIKNIDEVIERESKLNK